MATGDKKDTRMNTGRIVRVIGPVIDVEFGPDSMPAIYNALKVEADSPIGRISLVAEVQQHLAGNRVRAGAMSSTDGVTRGMEARHTGRNMRIRGGPRGLDGVPGREPRPWVEGVDYDDLRGALVDGRDMHGRAGGGVRREDRAWLHGLIERAEDRELQLFVLRSGLDDQLAVVQIGVVGDPLQTAEYGVPLRLLKTTATNSSRQGAFDPTAGGSERLLVDLEDEDVGAGAGRHLRDASTHGAATDDGDALDHLLTPFKS